MTLGTEDQGGLLGAPPLSVVRDTRGAWWVSVHRPGEPIHVFDAVGKFQRTVGARGRGPGEFVGPLVMSRSALDSISIVHDRGAARFSVLHAGGGPMANRPAAIHGIEQFAAGADGSLVVNANVASAATDGHPLHVMDPRTGAPARSFGAIEAVSRNDLPRALSRRVVFADTNHVWSLLPTRYVLERWNIRSGQVDASLTRKLDVFKPHWLPEVVAPNPSTEPAPYIVGAGVDSAGRLWVYTLIATTTRWSRSST